jgi:hypothetical protein
MSASIDMSQLIKGLTQKRERAHAAGVKAIHQFAWQVVANAQVLAPVETGALKASGRAEPPVVSGDDVEQVVGFNTPYAWFVHERLDLRHAEPTQAKYLETAMRNMTPKLAPFVAQKVKEAMSGQAK